MQILHNSFLISMLYFYIVATPDKKPDSLYIQGLSFISYKFYLLPKQKYLSTF